MKAIALVHNVTPVYEANGVTDQAEAEQHYEDTCRVYQAASPDEVPAPHLPSAFGGVSDGLVALHCMRGP